MSDSGYKLFSIQTINKVDEIYASDDFVDTKIAERLFSSSLVAIVTRAEQNKLKVSFVHLLIGKNESLLSVCT